MMESLLQNYLLGQTNLIDALRCLMMSRNSRSLLSRVCMALGATVQGGSNDLFSIMSYFSISQLILLKSSALFPPNWKRSEVVYPEALLNKLKRLWSEVVGSTGKPLCCLPATPLVLSHVGPCRDPFHDHWAAILWLLVTAFPLNIGLIPILIDLINNVDPRRWGRAQVSNSRY